MQVPPGWNRWIIAFTSLSRGCPVQTGDDGFGDRCVPSYTKPLVFKHPRQGAEAPVELRLAPTGAERRPRTCTAGTGIRYGNPFHHGDKALPKRFELLSNSLEGCCSHPLSYGNMLRPKAAFSIFLCYNQFIHGYAEQNAHSQQIINRWEYLAAEPFVHV